MWKPLVLLAIVANTALISLSEAQSCKGKHEIYSECSNLICRPLNCSQVGFPRPCPFPPDYEPSYCTGGIPACICEKGYARKRNGKCIPIKKCPSCGGDKNAVYGCIRNIRRCSDRNKTETVACNEECKEYGCVCRKNYVLDDNTGMCVRPRDCTPTCGKDEVYSSCTQGDCAPKTCLELGYPIPCPRIDPKYCIKGCLCKEGYVRAENGTCIPKDQCPSGCGGDSKARPGCGVNCGRYCSNYNSSEPVICPDICNLNGCDCKEGYVVNDNTGKCVLPSECSPSCGDNEVLSNCSQAGCGPWSCEDVGNTICVKIDPKYCTVGCICQEGYVRDENDVCIPVNECPTTCGEDEVYSDCMQNACVPKTCLESGYPFGCRQVDPKDCMKGCLCKEGYVQNANGTCIPQDQCPRDCPEDEVHSSCANGGCGKWNCSQLGEPDLCIDPYICLNGCICKDGYLRANNGTCVPKDQCPAPPCGKNEHFEFCRDTTCEPQCPNVQVTCAPPTGSGTCSAEPACVCDCGFVRDDEWKCIPVEECPPPCGQDEVYSACTQATCEPQTCLESFFPLGCPRPIYDCNKGCLCREGYVRDANGTCIPKDQCPPISCPENEVKTSCVNGGCSKQNCSQLKEPDICSDPYICLIGCICKEGYLRATNGTCVPITQCPGSSCGVNERLDDCPAWLCRPQHCSDVGYPIACPAYQGDSTTNPTCPGSPGCVCIDGFVRNDYGACIPVDQCPSCGGDFNATQGCGINCGRFCSNYKEENVICPLRPCLLNGCDCREGYVFDSNIGKCVLPDDCTPTCGDYEVYDICSNGGCQKRNCTQEGEPILCIDPITCIGACVCQEGYLRLKNGTCVPENQCPPTCPGPNEFYDCGVACDTVCLTLNEQSRDNCPIINIQCNKMCYCEDGYARNESNICIPIEDCPPPRCRDDERWEENPCQVCDPLTCSEVGKTKECPPVQDDDCDNTPTCICKAGLVRNSCGDCVPSSQC